VHDLTAARTHALPALYPAAATGLPPWPTPATTARASASHVPVKQPAEGRDLDIDTAPRCAKAGVRRIRVHDTRHTCGSLLAALDVHPRVAMQILRHAQISITMEIYTEVSRQRRHGRL
jgi:Phage integrase family